MRFLKNIEEEFLVLDCLGKIMQPIALAISGLLLNFIPAYTLPIAGDCIFTLNKILANKFNLEIHSKDYSV